MSDVAEKQRTVAIRMPDTLAAAVEAKARTEMLSTSAYCRRTLAAACSDRRDRFEKDQTSFG